MFAMTARLAFIARGFATAAKDIPTLVKVSLIIYLHYCFFFLRSIKPY